MAAAAVVVVAVAAVVLALGCSSSGAGLALSGGTAQTMAVVGPEVVHIVVGASTASVLGWPNCSRDCSQTGQQ